MNTKKTKFSLLIIVFLFSFIQNYNTSEAYKKYSDIKGNNVWYTNKVDSEWNN
jgi:Zn-dependent membrane protease YugP